MSSQISRRDFLKILPLLSLPLFGVEWPQLIEDVDHLPQRQAAPNILILVFDTLSAKHVSFHEYPRATTPNLDRFTQRATVYHTHYAGANFTSPGTASLLTGTYPWSHRAINLHSTVDSSFASKNIFSLAPDNYYKIAYTHNLLVASLLHQFRHDLDFWKKTRDLCLVDSQFSDIVFPNDFNVAFWSEWLFTRGSGEIPSSLFLSVADRARRFANKKILTREYGELFPRGLPNLHSLFFILEDAIDWITAQMVSFPQPYLGYFHFLPPHEPYATRRDFVDIFRDGWQPTVKESRFFSEGHPNKFLNQQRREYDEYLAYTDAEFGRLLEFMEQNGVPDNTYIIVTSDHGELFERGIRGHVTQTLYEPLIRVPLLISKPHQQQRKDVYTPTSCVDLLPTLLDITGQEIPDWAEGEILPTFGNAPVSADRPIFAVEAKSNPKQAPLNKATISLVKNQYKLIHYFGYGKAEDEYELFDLANDPEELEDLSMSAKSVALELKAKIAEKLQQVNQPHV